MGNVRNQMWIVIVTDVVVIVVVVVTVAIVDCVVIVPVAQLWWAVVLPVIGVNSSVMHIHWGPVSVHIVNWKEIKRSWRNNSNSEAL